LGRESGVPTMRYGPVVVLLERDVVTDAFAMTRREAERAMGQPVAMRIFRVVARKTTFAH
jgi:hypothetical protein